MLTEANLEAHDFRLDYAKELLAAMEHRRGKAALVEENNVLRARVAELTDLKELRERLDRNLIRVEEKNALQAKVDELIKDNKKLEAFADSHTKLAQYAVKYFESLRKLDVTTGPDLKNAKVMVEVYSAATIHRAQMVISEFDSLPHRQEPEQKRRRVSQ